MVESVLVITGALSGVLRAHESPQPLLRRTVSDWIMVQIGIVTEVGHPQQSREEAKTPGVTAAEPQWTRDGLTETSLTVWRSHPC